MKKSIKRMTAALLAAVISLGGPTAEARAAEGPDGAPYETYTYDKWSNANPAPNGYLPEKSIRGADYAIGEFNTPEDLFYCRSRNEVYIADTGNQRIIVLDEEFNLLRIITELQQEGEALLFQKPTGIFVEADGTMYIADQDRAEVIQCDQQLKVLQRFGKPESNLITEDFDYKPNKVVVDSYGKLYIQAVGVFQGLINLKPDGTFIKYFGANKVEMTTKRVLMKLWKTILSDKAADSMQTFNPIEYANVFLGEDDYIYATAAASENLSQMFTKLNPLGINIFSEKLDILTSPYLADVSVDHNGIITLVDGNSGIVYQLDKTGNHMFSFGGFGNQLGLFQRPRAIIEVKDKIYVLDGDKNDITCFGLTAFGEKVREAVNLYNSGFYLESVEPWLEVIKLNANYLLAYNGVGKAYYQLEQYEDAMWYFKQSNNKDNYSLAFKEYSLYLMRDNFGTIVVLVFLLIIGIKVTKHQVRKRKKTEKGGAAV